MFIAKWFISPLDNDETAFAELMMPYNDEDSKLCFWDWFGHEQFYIHSNGTSDWNAMTL